MSHSIFREKQTLLLVDEDAVFIDYFKKIFSPAVNVISYTQTTYILDEIKKHKPDLIILDSSMRGFNAVDTCIQLKSENSTKDIPVIFTRKGAGKNLQQGFDAGAVDYIFKPFNKDLIKSRIFSQLELTHTSKLLEIDHRRNRVTHLPDESYFHDELEKEWFHNIRCQRSLSLLMIEIDGFKHFKTIYGNAMVKTAQVSLARLLENNCNRAKDFVAQLDDARFAILATAERHEQMKIFAAKLRSVIASTEFYHLGHVRPFLITVSISLVSIKPDLSVKNSVDAFEQSALQHLLEALSYGDMVSDEPLSKLTLLTMARPTKGSQPPDIRPR